ncbi:uncharacterized protein LOC111712874 isoform X3 [Eurytemora carolleeae]|uniref:uncharacterized protein LOC111712874 isoform X3 n=1 Tax=Eurytemora carolleeae TaxID=1294199 RepID=UPI000C757916|nr:uncharacterized protein LOC111712874 isoform X3 [Eurytemora carolleeae]|eukprot:XP_023343393.1 uncharacterized protein LOC111712874 isoform X3 [Eurytemora affinis]
MQLSWMEQVLFATMLDLTEIFSKRLSIEAVGKTSLLFGCVCIDELWFSLCKYSQERGIDVWKLLSYMFNNNTVDLELNCGILQYTVFSSTSLQNKMLFWNLTGALINLLQVSGLRIQEADILMSYVRQELKPLLCEDQSQEVLRPVLQTLILLFKHAGPGFEILLDLWTYCSSRLNSSFKTNSNTLENAAFIPKNVVSWQNCVDDIVSGRSKHHDSFHLFLNLVAIATKAWKETKIKNIDRFKTRIIQKLPDSKAALLSDCGIFYVGTLFSVLVSISELDSLLPMVLGIIKPALARLGASNNLRLLGLNCKLNLALCCVGSRISLKPIGESVTGQLEKLVNQYCADQLDAQHRRIAQDGLKIYLEFLEELVVECTLTQDEASFVEPWIQNYLNVCSSSEISSILSTFNKVLCRCRAIYNLMEGVKVTPEQTEKEKMLISFINKLFNILLPSSKRLVTTLTCPLEIADVGFEFLNITMEGAKRRQYFSESTISILQIFTSINIRDELRVEFLFRTTAIPSVVEGVISTLKSSKLSEDLLLSVTGTCSLTVDPANQSYSKLEDVWTRLSDIYGLKAKERIKYSSHVALDIMSCVAYTSHAEVLLEMCKSCESLDKNKVRPKYMFRVFGWMARDFMNLIYRPNQSNNGFLLVVSTLLTQNKFFSSTWAPSSDELEGIKIFIPLSLGSMFLHPDFPNDTALQRKSEDIIRLYMGRFRIQDHPLLFIFSKKELKYPPGRMEFVLTLVFKVMVRLISVETIKTLQFLRQIISNLDSSSHQVFITKALSAVLELMFRKDSAVKQETKDLLKKLLPTIRKQVESFSGLQILFDEKLLEFLRHQFPVQKIKGLWIDKEN